MVKALHVVLDCADPASLASFWAKALGYEILWTFDPYVGVGGKGAAVTLLLQRVDEPKAGKNRMHLDLVVEDIEGTATELEAAGARRLHDGVRRLGPATWITMADPEGNEFDVAHG